MHANSHIHRQSPSIIRIPIPILIVILMQTRAESNEATTASAAPDEAAACRVCKQMVSLSCFSKKQRRKIGKGQSGACMRCLGTTNNAVSAKRNAKGGASAPTTTNSTKKTSTATASKSSKKFEVCEGVFFLRLLHCITNTRHDTLSLTAHLLHIHRWCKKNTPHSSYLNIHTHICTYA